MVNYLKVHLTLSILTAYRLYIPRGFYVFTAISYNKTSVERKRLKFLSNRNGSLALNIACYSHFHRKANIEKFCIDLIGVTNKKENNRNNIQN